MKFWKQINRRSIYKSDWLEVTLDRLEMPDGKIIEDFELMHYPHKAVGVVAVNENNEILLVRAYRYLHESFDWEIPGGVVEIGENILHACGRELMEETGYKAEGFEHLITYYPHKAMCDQKYHIYHGRNVSKSTDQFMEEEISEIGLFSRDKVMEMIGSGEINDGMSLVGLQKYFLMSSLP
jgi:8-oxo-dGTP pyrophosphatase MutT (NUDIX family)